MGTLEDYELPAEGNPMVINHTELEAVILVPKGETVEVNPGEVTEDIKNISEKLGVDTSDVVDMLGPLFLSDKYPTNEPIQIGSDKFETVILTKEEDIMEEDQEVEVEDETLALRETIEELRKKNEELRKENEKFQETLENLKYEQKLDIANRIVDFRVKKGLLDKEDVEDKAKDLAKLPQDILEELLEDAKHLSKKLSKPQPEVTEEVTKELSSKDKERLRQELFGRRD